MFFFSIYGIDFTCTKMSARSLWLIAIFFFYFVQIRNGPPCYWTICQQRISEEKTIKFPQNPYTPIWIHPENLAKTTCFSCHGPKSSQKRDVITQQSTKMNKDGKISTCSRLLLQHGCHWRWPATAGCSRLRLGSRLLTL